jgi:hypothetical protein
MSDPVTEALEGTMYGLMGAISGLGDPIVFKGPMIIKIIIKEGGNDKLERGCTKIEADWAGEAPPTVEALRLMLVRAVKRSGAALNFTTQAKLAPGAKALYKFTDKASKKAIFTLELGHNPGVAHKTYRRGGVTFEGATEFDVLCDKISFVSTSLTDETVVEMIDLYALAHCIQVDLSDIYAKLDKVENGLGTFKFLLTRPEDLKHAYWNAENVKGQTNFPYAQIFLSAFLYPILLFFRTSLRWHPRLDRWLAIPPEELEAGPGPEPGPGTESDPEAVPEGGKAPRARGAARGKAASTPAAPLSHLARQ